MLHAFPFQILQENKAKHFNTIGQNILTYQNDAFQFVSLKPKLAYCLKKKTEERLQSPFYYQ